MTILLPKKPADGGPDEFEIAGDGHPNPLAHDRIAAYIVDEILEP